MAVGKQQQQPKTYSKLKSDLKFDIFYESDTNASRDMFACGLLS